MSVVAADVVVQTARARPMAVIAIPLPEDSDVRRRLSRRSVAASAGITFRARSISDSIVLASAKSEKTPRTTSRLAGMARNSEYASACATIGTSSSSESLAARRSTVHIVRMGPLLPGKGECDA